MKDTIQEKIKQNRVNNTKFNKFLDVVHGIQFDTSECFYVGRNIRVQSKALTNLMVGYLMKENLGSELADMTGFPAVTGDDPAKAMATFFSETSSAALKLIRELERKDLSDYPSGKIKNERFNEYLELIDGIVFDVEFHHYKKPVKIYSNDKMAPLLQEYLHAHHSLSEMLREFENLPDDKAMEAVKGQFETMKAFFEIIEQKQNESV